MKHMVMCTAGHVDHGKTRLTLALTGTDTDRLKEEKRRGLTIEPGFARLVLPNKNTIDIVDVPGHERFIKNMLAGASGVDAALLVVAADEGFMPQTEEHIEILSLLGVKKGIVVITKADVVDESQLLAVKKNVSKRLKGSFFEGAPLLALSAVTGEGMEELVRELCSLSEVLLQRDTGRPFRLPADRVFSVSGFGAVVTGTLVEGSLRTGDEAVVYPGGQIVRVRELQSHNERIEFAEAGMRLAANLSGADKNCLLRGCTLAAPGSMRLSEYFAVRLSVCSSAPYSVKNASSLHFYQGTQQSLCRVRLLDSEELFPGDEGYAQLIFPEPIAARTGDRFILRFFSPVVTIGGGEILDIRPVRLKRGREDVAARLALLAGSAEERILQLARDGGRTFLQKHALWMLSGLTLRETERAIKTLTEGGELIETGLGLICKDELKAAERSARALLSEHHIKEPLSPGMPLGELRERLCVQPGRAADALLSLMRAEGAISIKGPCASLPGFKIALTAAQDDLRQEIAAAYEDFGLIPPPSGELERRFSGREKKLAEMLSLMLSTGELVELVPGLRVSRAAHQKALYIFKAMFARQSTVTLAEFRTELGISRKYAQMYLEHFDALKISRMSGEARILNAKR